MSVLISRERVNGVVNVNLRDTASTTNVVINGEVFGFVTEDQEVSLFR